MLRLLLMVPLLMSATVGGAAAAERIAIFSVENMTCGLCPITVRTVIGRVSGVRDVEVDLASGTAMVVFDDAQATLEDISEASRQAGFPAVLKK